MHFSRNGLAQVPKGHAEMVAAAIRTVFAQPDADHVRSELDVIAGMLGRQFPKVEAMHYSRHDLKQLADPTTVKISYTAGPAGRHPDRSGRYLL